MKKLKFSSELVLDKTGRGTQLFLPRRKCTKTYGACYGKAAGPETLVKIVKFKPAK